MFIIVDKYTDVPLYTKVFTDIQSAFDYLDKVKDTRDVRIVSKNIWMELNKPERR